MNDLISVIIPFYKSPLTKLRLCIESFIRQSYKNFELLIIDDGNPENIDYLKEEYEKRDARIRFIRQKMVVSAQPGIMVLTLPWVSILFFVIAMIM